MDPRQVEQDGEEILGACEDVIKQATQFASDSSLPLNSAGLCTQRSSVIAWEKQSGRVLTPVLSWQDTRGYAATSAMQSKQGLIQSRTGLRLSPHYGASKLSWLLQHDSAVKEANKAGTLLLGSLSSFLTNRLTKEGTYHIDFGNAARTLLWNLDSKSWDEKLLDYFEIPIELLPTCLPSRSSYGELKGSGIKLVAVNGDQNAAVYGAGELGSDVALVNIGTGAFIVAPCGNVPLFHSPLLTSVGDSSSEKSSFILEGTVNGAGAALSWAEEKWKLQLKNIDYSSVLSPPLFINTVGGLGSPWWKAEEAAQLEPFFLNAGKDLAPEVLKASIIESIVFMITANLKLMQEVRALSEVTLGGGISQDIIFCQKLSNLSGLKVSRIDTLELSARGIAWQAGDRKRDWKTDNKESFDPLPDKDLENRYQKFMRTINEL